MKVPWQGSAEWRRVLVYGLGISGRAATRLLRSHGVEVVGVDRRGRDELELEGLERDPGIELWLGSDPEELSPDLDGVVVSPGVPLERPLLSKARAAGMPVVAEVELGFLLANGPVIGITGSNGKSTTTAMTGELLRAAGYQVEVCGNIGRPLSACVEGEEGRVFVTELSSFQLEAIDTFRPQAAALLNLSADHLDRHCNLDIYAAAKRAVFRNQKDDDVAVLNADDPRVAATEVSVRRRLFSRRGPVEDGLYLEGDSVMEAIPGLPAAELFHRGDLALPGPHNLENAMAAALLGRAVGAGWAGMRPALSGFAGLPHRLERVQERAGVTWFDDSKGTNVAATARSLEGFAEGAVHLIVGGRSKANNVAALAPVVRRKVRRLYLIGEAAEQIDEALGEVVPTEICGNLERAVSSAAVRARPGDSVVLSPACASFDQYRDFVERGLHFQSLVRALDG
jgi:UDP-N-acetylmuramoylalanine--D-glutamate ligase